MPLVALDTMIIDLMANLLDRGQEWGETAEALRPPPYPLELEEQSWAMYWLLALAPAWKSCLYTFADLVYEELEAIPSERNPLATRLIGLAQEVRESHPAEFSEENAQDIPAASAVARYGIRSKDSVHVANAIRIGASHFLTLDGGILKSAQVVWRDWDLCISTPSKFLLRAVRSGAPWPAFVPWPWEVGR